MMPEVSTNELAKIRMMAAQLRHHAQATHDADYVAMFERAAAELEQKLQDAERQMGSSRSPR